MSARHPLLEFRDVFAHLPGAHQQGSHFGSRREVVRAVDGVSLRIERGETVSIVGETGSGKSTLVRMAIGLVRPTAGDVLFDGIPVRPNRQLKTIRRRMAIVAQDPFDSLNPRQKVSTIVGLPLRVQREPATRGRVGEALAAVGLDPVDYLSRYPHEMSGGQRQRVALARALILHPELLIADEPVSALDMSVRAQILNLLADVKESYGLTYLLVAHDFGMVRYLSTRVVVLYCGVVVEDANASTVFQKPKHPYTQALLASVPSLRPRPDTVLRIVGEPPSPVDVPSGCRFHPRCAYAVERCKNEVPQLRSLAGGLVACHLAETLAHTASDSAAPALVIST